MTDVDEISANRLIELLNSGRSPRIIDIRANSAFETAHIPGSENIPFTMLPREVERLAGADHIVTVCPHGKASQQAVRLITAYEGVGEAQVESLAGGLAAWDGPIEGESPPANSAPF